MLLPAEPPPLPCPEDAPELVVAPELGEYVESLGLEQPPAANPKSNADASTDAHEGNPRM